MSELRIAVLGVGVMGADHVARISSRISGARVAVVNDYVTEKAEQIAASIPGCRAIVDPLDAIVDPEVDAVVLATPGPTHEKQLLACLEHGKPVLCEKPLTTDVETSLGVVKREAELGKAVDPGGVHAPVRSRVRPAEGTARRRRTGTSVGAALRAPQSRRPAELRQRDGGARLAGTRGGRHAVPVRRGDRVESRSSSLPPIPGARRVLPTPRSPSCAPRPVATSTSNLFVTTGVAYEVRTEVVGEKGSAMIGLDVGLVRKSAPGHWGGQITPGFRERFGQAYDTEFQRWVDAVRCRRQCRRPPAWDGYAAAAVCEAGVESLESGERVAVELAERVDA